MDTGSIDVKEIQVRPFRVYLVYLVYIVLSMLIIHMIIPLALELVIDKIGIIKQETVLPYLGRTYDVFFIVSFFILSSFLLSITVNAKIINDNIYDVSFMCLTVVKVIGHLLKSKFKLCVFLCLHYIIPLAIYISLTSKFNSCEVQICPASDHSFLATIKPSLMFTLSSMIYGFVLLFMISGGYYTGFLATLFRHHFGFFDIDKHNKYCHP